MHFIVISFQNKKMLTIFVFLDKIGLNSENFKFERQPILSFIDKVLFIFHLVMRFL